MNLGDGLKLETELLDGRTKLILAPYERKSKTAPKMGNKAKIPKQSLRTTQTGHILKSTQNTDGRHESLLQKSRTAASDPSQAKGDKSRMIFSPAKSFSKEDPDTGRLCVQRNGTAETPDSWRTKHDKQSAVFKQKPQKKHMTVEDIRNSLVCLTEEQLQQILMAVGQGNKPISQIESGKKEEKCQNNLHLNSFPNESKDENIMGLLQKAEDISPIPDDSISVLNKKQKTSMPCEQKLAIKTVWKPSDMFSTLGEREREKSLLEAKKFQWRKELDEQVALKKKEKEASEEQKKCPWGKCGSTKTIWNNFEAVDQWQSSSSPSSVLSRSPNLRLSAHPGGDSIPGTSQTLEEATPLEHPFSAVRKEQQRKWIEELNKQKEEDKQRKLKEKMAYAQGEEHDRWAMHFDSLKFYPSSRSQLSSHATQKQPDYLCLSPEMTDVSSPYTPLSGGQLGPAEEENLGKSTRDEATTNVEKTSFLRSMTALLDPAQLEERDRRRQKQLEHQKAITAQVEEKRRKKQLEEQQRKQEEDEEERRLAREREEMQRRFEEDLLEQKRKEEMMALKTSELYQSMQRAQELAQRLRQEQRIRELEQKGHDISNLLRGLAGEPGPTEPSPEPSGQRARAAASPGIPPGTSPRKDTAVQTDEPQPGRSSRETGPEGSERTGLLSPELFIECDRQPNGGKSQDGLEEARRASPEKENSFQHLYEPFARTERPKPRGRGAKKPDWNINRPAKKFVPASERYPKHLQRQREESKVRRQMELLQLLERNAPTRLFLLPRDASPEPAPRQDPPQEPQEPQESRGQQEEELKKLHSSRDRYGAVFQHHRPAYFRNEKRNSISKGTPEPGKEPLRSPCRPGRLREEAGLWPRWFRRVSGGQERWKDSWV
ncbi:coiled-coil domain-containing protein 66 isoform X2 [Gracilinanus agilis]|uniref:coiled-coil domain-containing protein 66 isoform X2 n=1 Tax=Gracilinanus agilis TaxID=191870 RepID=UPI001CFD8424|nr:coiled-coil domain-containing protein 66 isoform X2 [Gracilinanus agilis]